MSLKEVLAPAMQMAAGYPIEAKQPTVWNGIKRASNNGRIAKAVFLPHAGEKREAPEAGEIFVQKDLLQTLQKWWMQNRRH